MISGFQTVTKFKRSGTLCFAWCVTGGDRERGYHKGKGEVRVRLFDVGELKKETSTLIVWYLCLCWCWYDSESINNIHHYRYVGGGRERQHNDAPPMAMAALRHK
jgi:hypothetical protein